MTLLCYILGHERLQLIEADVAEARRAMETE